MKKKEPIAKVGDLLQFTDLDMSTHRCIITQVQKLNYSIVYWIDWVNSLDNKGFPSYTHDHDLRSQRFWRKLS